MGDVSEFSLGVRLFLAAYPWRRIDPVPWAMPRVPLARSRVALVSSAGLVPPDAALFDASVRGGDVSFREIAADAELRALRDGHRSESFDHAGMALDRNLVLPLDRLHELARDGRIGAVAPRHFSFMGSITAPGRLVRTTAPEIATRLRTDEVDIALLVPV